MALLSQCPGHPWDYQCSNMVSHSASAMVPLCDDCAKKAGTYKKKWHEMTLEEKVEDLNQRVGGVEIHTRPIG